VLVGAAAVDQAEAVVALITDGTRGVYYARRTRASAAGWRL